MNRIGLAHGSSVRADIRVEELRTTHFEEWAELLTASPEGSVYALPQYLEALCRAGGGRFSILAARRGQELAGGVALYERDSRLGPWVAPRPLLYYNGIVLRRYETRYPSEQTARHLKVLEALERSIAGKGYARLTLASRSTFQDARPFVAAGWGVEPRYTYEVPISDLPALWGRMEQNLRRLVKRCEREGMTVSNDDDFDSFLRLHRAIMSRRGQQLYLPERAFSGFFADLRAAGLCRLLQARSTEGRVIATELVLTGPAGVCDFGAAATDEEFLKTGVSAFLRWKSFEALAKEGYHAADLTDAALNPVTHFKSQLGGDLKLTLMLDAPRSLAYRVGNGARSLLKKRRSSRSPAVDQEPS